jgi:hypothetical protein
MPAHQGFESRVIAFGDAPGKLCVGRVRRPSAL